jgi:hypothetical protein
LSSTIDAEPFRLDAEIQQTCAAGVERRAHGRYLRGRR